MATKASILSDVQRILQDDATVLNPTTEITDVIQNEAVQLYSKHKPYLRVADLTADGTYDYTINTTNFPGWSDDFSHIQDVEYPAGEYQDPNMTPFEEWMIYEDTTTKYLRFTETTPASGYTIRARYTTPHSVPDSGNATIYANDVGAFCNLAASLCAMAISNHYGQTSNSTITADAVAYRDKSDIWASRAKDLYKKYTELMFPDHIQAAMAFREFDTSFAALGYSRLTHPEWSR